MTAAPLVGPGRLGEPAGVAGPSRIATSPPARAVVPVLAVREARRLMLHPLTLAGFGIFAFNAGAVLVDDQGPRAAFEAVGMLPAFYPGILLILAGTLLAGRDVRARSTEVLAPLPGRAEERVLAWLLAGLAPALVGMLATVGLHVGFLVLGRYSAIDPAGVPNVWHLLAVGATLWGATAFGVMVGVWAPSRAAAVLGAVVLVVANVVLGRSEELQLLGTATSWARWGLYADDWAGVVPGSPALHLAYLMSLSFMAAAAAWVRVADRRTAPVVVGLVALGSAVATGLGQLP